MENTMDKQNDKQQEQHVDEGAKKWKASINRC